MHSNYSPDSATTLDALVRQARDLGLDRIALTDHNTAEGALELALREPKLTIVGEEVRTTEGEVIGLFIDRTIEADATPEEVLQQIHDAGGLTYVPHPFDPRRAHYTPARVEELAPMIDIIETHNRNCRPEQNAAAAEMAKRLDKPGVCGCDAHQARHLAHCWLEMPDFATPAQFLVALRDARHVINGS